MWADTEHLSAAPNIRRESVQISMKYPAKPDGVRTGLLSTCGRETSSGPFLSQTTNSLHEVGKSVYTLFEPPVRLDLRRNLTWD